MSVSKILIVGGAGFIGSHFTDHFLANPQVTRLTVFDNFSSGKQWHYECHTGNPAFCVFRGDAKDPEALMEVMDGQDLVIHLAANPDIAAAVTDPDIDFREGTVLTRNVLEAMRQSRVHRLLYASGSGVYGDLGEIEAAEDWGPMSPISTYGASKMACEVLIASYTAMFDLSACAFRFGNVVGPRQTHGVGYDFVRNLRKEPTRLPILGDGSQSKSYVHVSDIVDAVWAAHNKCPTGFNVFNVATGDYITVREIADVAVQCLQLDPASVEYQFTGGSRGWKGDVPVVRLDTDRIRALGWTNKRNSLEAIRDSILSMLEEIENAGR